MSKPSQHPGGGTRIGRPARISLVLQDLRGGGAERMMVNLAGGLVSVGHNVEIVAVRPEGAFRAHVPPEVPVISLGTGRVSRSLPALARYLNECQPDVALSTLTHVNVALVLSARLARSGTRIVVREASRIKESAQAASGLVRLGYRLLPRVYPRADHIVAVSEAVAEEVRKVTGLGTERVTALRNPVLTPADLEAIEETQSAPHAWLEDDGAPVILSVGRLAPAKDHATLLTAFARVRQEREARLVILGEGELKESLSQQARGLGVHDAVLLGGFAAPPYAWMKRSAVLAHTSRWEGSPNVIVEALACGLPVVATDCPGGTAEVLEGGRYGRLVRTGDAAAIAEALFATLDRAPMANLRERAAAFTVDAVLPSYESVLLV